MNFEFWRATGALSVLAKDRHQKQRTDQALKLSVFNADALVPRFLHFTKKEESFDPNAPDGDTCAV